MARAAGCSGMARDGEECPCISLSQGCAGLSLQEPKQAKQQSVQQCCQVLHVPHARHLQKQGQAQAMQHCHAGMRE